MAAAVQVRSVEDSASVAEALGQIARRGLVDDLSAIEQMLHLEGLTAGLRWQLPSEGGPGRWASFYAGSGSPIDRIIVGRREGYSDLFLDSLSVIFKEAKCASFEIAEAAFGTTLEVTMMPQGHGDLPPYPYRSLDLTADNGRRIHIVVEDEGCQIRMNWPSPANGARSPGD